MLILAQATMHRRIRHQTAQPVVSEVSGNLFDNVDLSRAIRSPRWQVHGEDISACVNDHVADRLEASNDVIGRERCAEDAVDLTHANPNRALLGRQAVVNDVDGSGMHH